MRVDRRGDRAHPDRETLRDDARGERPPEGHDRGVDRPPKGADEGPSGPARARSRARAPASRRDDRTQINGEGPPMNHRMILSFAAVFLASKAALAAPKADLAVSISPPSGVHVYESGHYTVT